MVDRYFDVTSAVDGREAVVVVSGDLDLATVPRLDAELGDVLALDGEAPALERVVVDLSGVDFVDSSGLTALIKTNRRAKDDGLAFVLRAPSARVMRTLELTQLETVLEIEPG